MSSNGLETTVVISDTHHPSQHQDSVERVLDYVYAEQPEEVVLIGDHLDFGPLSRYDKDPRAGATVQQQLDACSDFLHELRNVAPKARIRYREGNHEGRITKYLIRNAPHLLFLQSEGEDVLSVPHLLGLAGLGIEWCPEHAPLELHGVLFEHGNLASSYSAYTARRMVERRRMDVVHGHTHRLGSYWFTGYRDQVRGFEVGCLIDRDSPDASYVQSPNWQLGFGVGKYDPSDDLYSFQVVEIDPRRGFVVDGKRF